MSNWTLPITVEIFDWLHLFKNLVKFIKLIEIPIKKYFTVLFNPLPRIRPEKLSDAWLVLSSCVLLLVREN